MVSDNRIDEFINKFNERYAFKKRINAIICFLIFICGLSAILYSKFIFHNNIIDRLRYMTFCGTIFTSIISLIVGFICAIESKNQKEITYKWTYFLRLSSAATEVVIFVIVLLGLLSPVPDNPDVNTFPGIIMHLIIPLLTILSFIFNDPPIGKLKIYEPLYGTIFITIYTVIMTFLFATRILPSEKAPYSFLDFDNNSLAFKLLVLLIVYICGYIVSKLLSYLNSKMSWIWFYDLKKRG